jgi:hypothetical protein
VTAGTSLLVITTTGPSSVVIATISPPSKNPKPP